MSVADQSTVQMMMIVADSFLVAREKRGEFKELTDVGRVERFRPDGTCSAGAYTGDWALPGSGRTREILAFLKQNIETGGYLDGFKTTVKAMFLSPESVTGWSLGWVRWTRMGADICHRMNWRMRWPTH